jgi:uncharacterized protein (DUF2235 family)
MRNWLKRTAVRLLITGFSIGIMAFGTGCASVSDEETKPAEVEKKFTGNPALPKSIYVFHDGTRNDAYSGTNVRKLFEAVLAAGDPQTAAIYVDGVGSSSTRLLGAANGYGMEKRISRAYDFIAQSYRPGDAVYIFGFSRGAHSARALAGLVAYAGVPPASALDSDQRLRQLNRVIEIAKTKNDVDFVDTWKSWKPGTEAPLAKEIQTRLDVVTRPVEIQFLGVWDTVPGSNFKEFGECKELPNRRDGDRYKSDSYPPIRKIFHAVSVDEKRSKFQPILLCPSINPVYTVVTETWFPGAHSDVGGGYSDSQALSNLSLQWMMDALRNSGVTLAPTPQFAGDPRGLAHWSIGDRPGNIGSECQDRVMPARAVMHPSVQARRDAGSAPVRFNGATENRPYPMPCSGR